MPIIMPVMHFPLRCVQPTGRLGVGMVGLLTFLPPGETASPMDDLAPLPGGAFSCGSSARCATNFAARR